MKSLCNGWILRKGSNFAVSLLSFLLWVTIIASCADAQDAKPGVHHIQDVVPISSSRNRNDLKNPRILKRCATKSPQNGGKLDRVKIPTWLFTPGKTSNYSYALEEYKIEGHGTKNFCEKLSTNTTTTTSIDDYHYILEAKGLANTNKIYGIHPLVTIVLGNGYLCVGSGSAADYFSPEEYCLDEINGQGDKVNATFRTCSRSKNKPVLSKCCPVGMIWNHNQKTCVSYSEQTQWDPGYLSADRDLQPLPVERVNPAYRFNILSRTCELGFWEEDDCHVEAHPLTDNRLVYLGPNRDWLYLEFNVTGFCFDRTFRSDGTLIHMVGICENTIPLTKNRTVSWIYMICTYIGSVFHLLTCATYLLTWKLQNIHGRTLCCCTASLMIMNILLGTAHLLGILKTEQQTTFCISNAIAAQYFFIASFSWLLVINLDLWWTFRSIRPDSGKSLKRLLRYSILGFGLPLLVTVISVTLEFTYTCRTSRVLVPEYGYAYCFISPWAQGPYLYYILAGIIALTYIFAAVTFFGLYTYKKDATHLRTTKSGEDKQTVLLFLKLSVVMGLAWIFEVISWYASKEGDTNWIWISLDLYNGLSGILIFIIFVCKEKTLNMLKQTCPVFNHLASVCTRFATSITGKSTSDTSNGVSSTEGNNPPNPPSAAQQLKDQQKCSQTVAYTKDGHINHGYQQ